MPQPLTHLGEIFREDFLSPFHIAENGGVIGNGALVNRGLTISANNQSVRYAQTFPNVNDFTVSIKGSFDIASSNDYGALFYFRVGTSANDNTIRIFKTPASSRLTFRIANGSGSRDCAMDSGTEVPETESMVHFTRSGNTLKIYVNGVEQAATTSGASITGVLPLGSAMVKAIGFGDHVAAIKGQYKGWRMRNYAMSAEEVADDYNNSTFSELKPVAYYALHDKIGSTAPFTTTDVARGADATLGDGSTSTTFPTKLTNTNGYSFDGGDYLVIANSEDISFTGAFWLGMWVKGVVPTSNRGYFTKNAGNNVLTTQANTSYELSYFNTDGNVYFQISDGVTKNNVVVAASSVFTGAITLVVAAYNGTENADALKIYAGGREVASGSAAGMNGVQVLSDDLWIGGSVLGGHTDDMYQAFVGEGKITETQVKALYSQGPYYLGRK